MRFILTIIFNAFFLYSFCLRAAPVELEKSQRYQQMRARSSVYNNDILDDRIIRVSLPEQDNITGTAQSDVEVYETVFQMPEEEILYYTCPMHPSVHVIPIVFSGGIDKCSVCMSPLVPVSKESAQIRTSENLILKMTPQEVVTSGIEVGPAVIRNTFKEAAHIQGNVSLELDVKKQLGDYFAIRKMLETIPEYDKDSLRRAQQEYLLVRSELISAGPGEDFVAGLEQGYKKVEDIVLPDNMMWVDALLSRKDVAGELTGQQVFLALAGEPSVTSKGTISSVEPVLENGADMVRLKILADNDRGYFLSGMVVDIFIEISQGMRLVVPLSSVVEHGLQKRVFVEIAGGEYVLREVLVGMPVFSYVDGFRQEVYPVFNGLDPDDKVVVKGSEFISYQLQSGSD